MQRLWTALFLCLPCTALCASEGQAVSAPPPLVAVPATLALGQQIPGSTTARSLWLVNDSAEELALLGAQGNCGCVQVQNFTPKSLAAGEALELKVNVRAPQVDGQAKETRLTVATSRGECNVPVSVTADAQAVPAEEASEVPESPLRVIAESLTFDGLTPEARLSTELWFVNSGSEALVIEALRTSCGCVKAGGRYPCTIEAGRALRVPLDLQGAKQPQAQQVRWLDVSLANQTALRVPLCVTTIASDAAASDAVVGGA